MDDKTQLTKMKEELEEKQSLLATQQNTLNAAKAEQEKARSTFNFIKPATATKPEWSWPC